MTRQEFLQELQTALQGQLSQTVISDNIRYYDQYIKGEVGKGNSEESVIEALGNPRLIAKTLIDTTEAYGRAAGPGYSSDDMDTENFQQSKPRRGFRAGYSQEDGWDIRFGRLKLNSWYGKCLMAAAAVLLIVAAANVVAFLLPILVPVILILLLCSLFFGGRR